MDVRVSLGTRIRILRVECSLSQRELAQRMGVSPQAVSRWETDRACPDIALLWPLSRLLRVSLDELLSPEYGTEAPLRAVQRRN